MNSDFDSFLTCLCQGLFGSFNQTLIEEWLTIILLVSLLLHIYLLLQLWFIDIIKKMNFDFDSFFNLLSQRIGGSFNQILIT